MFKSPVTENGSSQGQNVALTVFYVPSSLDSEPQTLCPKQVHAAAKQLHFLPAATQREAFPMCTKVSRCPANMAHTRQSKPGSGLGFQVQFRKTFQGVPSWL